MTVVRITPSEIVALICLVFIAWVILFFWGVP